jgi:hypothetical protein
MSKANQAYQAEFGSMPWHCFMQPSNFFSFFSLFSFQTMSNYPPPPPAQQDYNANKTYSEQQAYPPPSQPYSSGPPSYSYNNQNYDPEATTYGNYGQPPPQQMNMSGDHKVEPSTGFKDVWATVAWLLNMGAFIGLSVIGLRAYNANHSSYGGVPSQSPSTGITFDTTAFIILGLAVVIGFGLSVLYFLFANKFPRILIKVTFALSILLYFAVTFYYFAVHYYSAAIVFLIFSVIYAFMWFAWKNRIPFATSKWPNSVGMERRDRTAMSLIATVKVSFDCVHDLLIYVLLPLP